MSKAQYDELQGLFKLTDKAKPKPEDITAIRLFLDEHPEKAKHIGDMAIQAETQLLMNAFSNSQGARIATEQVMYNMSKGLGYETAPAIERPLIKHVLLCWLRLHLCEIKYSQATDSGCTMEQGAYWEKKLSANQRRYLRAVETLARIRKLNINIQVNVAEKIVVTG